LPQSVDYYRNGRQQGGGTCLTVAGQSLLQLFTRLEQQHRQFLQQLNQGLADDPDVQMLLKRLVIKPAQPISCLAQLPPFKRVSSMPKCWLN